MQWVMSLEVADTSKDNNPDEIAEILFEEHQQKSARIDSLLNRGHSPSWESHINEALELLERQGRVYVERCPRTKEGYLRRDILSSDVVYFDSFPSIHRRTLLYKTGVEYGDFTINHVLGCAHGCDYPCYAMQISKRYGRVSDYDDWMHPRLVGNAMELLEKEIPKFSSKIRFVHLSFMTDPFMYDAVNRRTYPWVKNLTLKIIKRLNHENIKVTSLTKGFFPSELTEECFSRENEYGITLVSFNSKFHERFEPFSPSAEKRLASLKDLSDAGFKTWVSLEPYPTPNIVKQDLGEILNKVEFADKLIFGKWNYNPEVNGYESHKKFYTDCSDKVIQFCHENDITFHIKAHTPRSTKRTNDLFRDD
jgi:DNA repair photolyase